MRTKEDLKYFQCLPLDMKIRMSNRRLLEWVSFWGVDGVYISFSGGKDSTVLADLYARLCSKNGWRMCLVFVNTGLEFPEIQSFVKTFAEWLHQTYTIEVELVILRPEMTFVDVIKKYGYPIISKECATVIEYAKKGGNWAIERINGQRKQTNGEKSQFNNSKYKPLMEVDFNISSRCCDVMKKAPVHRYSKQTGRKPITAQMTSESKLREQQWIKFGCNAFVSKRPISNPMSFWTTQDVLHYIKENNIPLCSVYGEIVYKENPEQLRFKFGIEELTTTLRDRTGCVFCGFGCHLDKKSRWLNLKETHPKHYEYCIGGGEYDEQGVWQPNKNGLGMGHVFGELNKIYGDDFIEF